MKVAKHAPASGHSRSIPYCSTVWNNDMTNAFIRAPGIPFIELRRVRFSVQFPPPPATRLACYVRLIRRLSEFERAARGLLFIHRRPISGTGSANSDRRIITRRHNPPQHVPSRTCVRRLDSNCVKNCKSFIHHNNGSTTTIKNIITNLVKLN